MWIFPIESEDLAHPKHCKTCGAAIVWARTKANKDAPLNAGFKVLQTLSLGDGTFLQLLPNEASHFSTCPQRQQFSNKNRRKK